jgi:hypothetical protein
MLHKYKLTPDYFVRRALKAKSFSELVDANIGLFNLYQRHAEYHFQQLIECIKKPRKEIA